MTHIIIFRMSGGILMRLRSRRCYRLTAAGPARIGPEARIDRRCPPCGGANRISDVNILARSSNAVAHEPVRRTFRAQRGIDIGIGKGRIAGNTVISRVLAVPHSHAGGNDNAGPIGITDRDAYKEDQDCQKYFFHYCTVTVYVPYNMVPE